MQQQSFLDDRAPRDVNAESKLDIELPWPPSANHYKSQRAMIPSIDEMKRVFHGDWGSFWKFVRSKTHVSSFLTDEAKEFHVKVESCVIKANARKYYTKHIRMTVWVYPPDRRRRDTSNLLKMLEDALVQSKVMADDSQIKEHHIFFLDQLVEGGKVVVRVEELL